MRSADRPRSRRRRSVLRSVGGLVGAVGAGGVGLPGCLANQFSGDGTPDHAKWCYAPGAVGRRHYRFTLLRTGSVLENGDELPGDTLSSFERFVGLPGFRDLVGMGFREMERGLSLGASSVLAGEYDPATVVATLTDSAFAEVGTHRGYTVLVNAARGDAVGVSGDDLVLGTDEASVGAGAAVRLTVDARRGDAERYLADDDFGTLVGELGDGDYVSGTTRDRVAETSPELGRFEGQVASGFRWRIAGATTRVGRVTVFEDADAADVGAVREWVGRKREETGRIAAARAVETERRGRAVVVTFEVDTDDL